MKFTVEQLQRIAVSPTVDRTALAQHKLLDTLAVATEVFRTEVASSDDARLKVAIELGNFIINTKLQEEGVSVIDGSDVLDEFFMEFFKSLTDDAALSDQAYLAFRKGLSDTAEITEKAIFDLLKVLNNLAVVEDALAKDFARPVASPPVQTTDVARLHPNKHASDETTFSDELERRDFGKGLSTTGAIEESHAFDVAKPLNTWGTVLAQISNELQKPFSSAAGTQDDSVWSLDKDLHSISELIDETPWFYVHKGLTDSAGLADVTERGVAKAKFDSTFVDDLNQLNTHKHLKSFVGVTDDVDGAASILDDQEMHFVKNKTNVVGIGDALFITIIISRNFFDTLHIQERFQVYLTKQLNDGFTTNDQVFLSPNKHASDRITTFDEAPIFDTAKLIKSVLGIGESHSLSAGKFKQDSAVISDTGQLRSQGYSDFDYFAEDYVGSSRSF